MKPNLLVLSTGKWQGKVISLLRSPFVIGRGLGCTLRPTSPQIGDRHCSLLLRDGKVFVENLHNPGATFVDDLPIKGIVEIHHGQRLRIGPLLFEVRLADETPAPLSSADEEAAALLLDGQAKSDGDDGWTTVTPRAAASYREELDPLAPSGPVGKEGRPAPSEDTTDAARKILKKYGKLVGLKQPRRIS